jgi:hypothetical protein
MAVSFIGGRNRRTRRKPHFFNCKNIEILEKMTKMLEA